MSDTQQPGTNFLPDWNEIWKNQMEESEKAKGGPEYSGLWKERKGAERFFKRSEGPARERIRRTLAHLPLTPTSRILDIGAGPGSLAIPIAKKVAHVTAIEPAEGMADILEERIEHEGITNIRVIRKRWEDTTPDEMGGHFDLTIASFSLGMKDIREAISRMDDVTRGIVALYWFANETPWEQDMAALWPALHGKAYAPGPKGNVLYNVLHQMGIFPNAVVFPLEYHDEYRDIEEALEQCRERFMAEPHHDSILRSFCEKQLVPVPGGVSFRGTSLRVKFWWDSGMYRTSGFSRPDNPEVQG
jgi:SAM-dependent methyltransferase